jgi:RNA polymerase sigma-70 factor, ECF subfamily
MSERTDKQLVGRIREGDTAAFTVLHARYRIRLFAYCYRLVPNRHQAEEIVQTTFIKAYESLRSLEKGELFYYWLFSIARNEVYTFLRQKRSNGMTSSIDEEDVIGDVETPLEKLVNEETADLLRRSIDQLKIEYREVLILRQYEKFSYAEIATITGDTISSVESRLFKARKQLAKIMAPYYK